MRHYETTYILRPNLGEEQFVEIIERTNAIIEGDNGAVIDIDRSSDRWGMKKLAYEIKKETQGYYIYMNYAAPGSTIQEIERIFRIDDRVLRYLTVKLADEIDTAGIDQEKERIAALAAAKVAKEEELAKQDEEGEREGESSDSKVDKAVDKIEEKAETVTEEKDTPKQEQPNDAAQEKAQ
ncbi:MAG: 30S ribosomal protein S6 [Candidatus Electrothrix sp. AW5]|nr:30S ribosomal protein S6 [Candidatus Electrothrix gigas]